ncbi:protein ATP1B4 isoform X3 [Rhinatrema bivittatum]|uniref:protein ATP1B4 isoform X3 n=1 Tax=Rhinatrema bivittatum TaxID=194408 RepID=UPI001126CA8C|nr:protein ATP1B4 isoform X3 [Rhinatrema bivittatum]
MSDATRSVNATNCFLGPAMERNSTSAVADDHHANDLYKPGKNNEERHKDSEEESEEGEPAVVKKTWAQRMEEVKKFIWNPEQREFMGRTAESWGVMIRPYTNGFQFAFNASETSTWSSHVESMHDFLEAYNDSLQAAKNVECTPGRYFLQEGAVMDEKKACQFKRSFLENCSGIEDPTFGYSEGKPCLFLKMNRIIGYRPGQGIPVSVSCEVQKSDESDLKAINFYPGNGTFDLMYFPFYGKLTHPNYTSPLVAVQFTDVKKNRPVGIQCKLHGKGIVNDHSNDRFLGRIFLTLNIGV